MQYRTTTVIAAVLVLAGVTAAAPATLPQDIVFSANGTARAGTPGETLVPPEIFNTFVTRDAGECFSVDTGSPKNMHWNDVDQFVVVDSKKCRPKLQLQNGTCHKHMDLGNRCSAFCQTSGFYFYGQPIDLMGGKMCRYGEGCELKREESYRVEVSNTETEKHVFDALMSLSPSATWGLGWKKIVIGGQTIGDTIKPKPLAKSSATLTALTKRDYLPPTGESYKQNSLENWRQDMEDEISDRVPEASIDPADDYIARVLAEMEAQGQQVNGPVLRGAEIPPVVATPENEVLNQFDEAYGPSFARPGDGRRNADAEAFLAALEEPHTWKDRLREKKNRFTDTVRSLFEKGPKHDHSRPDIATARSQLRAADRKARKARKQAARKEAKEREARKAAGIDTLADEQPDSERPLPSGLVGTPGAAGGSALETANRGAALGSYAATNYYDDYNVDGPSDSSAPPPVPKSKSKETTSTNTATSSSGGVTIPQFQVPVPKITNPQITVAASFSAHWTRDWTRTYQHTVERATFTSLTHKQIPGEGCGAFWAVPVQVAYCGWLSLPRVQHDQQERVTHWLKSTDNTYEGAFKLGSWPGADAATPALSAADPHPPQQWNITSGRCPVNYHEMPYCQASPLVVPDRNGGPAQALQRTVWRPYDCDTGELLPTHMQPREVREQVNFDEFFKYQALKDPRLYNPHLAWYPLDDSASHHGGHRSE